MDDLFQCLPIVIGGNGNYQKITASPSICEKMDHHHLYSAYIIHIYIYDPADLFFQDTARWQSFAKLV